MGLRGLPHVVDIRTVGLMAAVDLAPLSEGPGVRGFRALESAFHDQSLVIRVTGDTLALTPPLIVSEAGIAEILDKLTRVIKAVA